MVDKQKAWLEPTHQPHEFNLCGEFNFDTVPAIYETLLQRVKQGQISVLNLRHVVLGNSALLGLLLGLKKVALHEGHILMFTELPQKLLAIAEVTDVLPLLTE